MSPWIGPGPHDRDLDHQIVEFARLEPRQHRHLRAALDLKDAERIGPAQHLVDRGLLGRDRGEVVAAGRNAARSARSALRMQVSMPSARTSTFRMPSASRSSLSHSMTVRSSIAAFSIGTSSDKRPAGDHEAADMLRQMPREADQLAGEVERQAQVAVGRVEPGLAHPLVGDRVVATSPRPCRRARRRHRLTGPAPCRLRGSRRARDSRSPSRPARRGRGRISRRCTG